MSKHNYTQYSNKNQNDEGKSTVKREEFLILDDIIESAPVVETVEAVEIIEAPEVKMVVETVDTVTLPKIVNGFVANCTKLNVRVQPAADADVVCVLDNGTEIEINVNNSTDEWFSICTAAGIEGYCMRKFVNAKL